jgi:hypothetical protein
MQNREILESKRQLGDRNVVVANDNAARIAPAAPLQHDQTQAKPDQGAQLTCWFFNREKCSTGCSGAGERSRRDENRAGLYGGRDALGIVD